VEPGVQFTERQEGGNPREKTSRVGGRWGSRHRKRRFLGERHSHFLIFKKRNGKDDQGTSGERRERKALRAGNQKKSAQTARALEKANPVEENIKKKKEES